MSQIRMSEAERIEALQGFSYSQEEASFLNIACLQSGYFLRRQFAEHRGRQNGGVITSFLEKLLAKEHARVSVYAHNVHIYHLCARPLYAAIGQSDNRNRREHQPLTIKSKLMALDFVLAHPQYRYLATELEKVEYFTQSRGVALAALPTKLYRSDGAGSGATSRFFIDKYPIFTTESAAEEDASSPVVSFCFVDQGQTTASHFETFLGQYRSLFAALGAVAVVYVAANRAPFKRAERVFEKVFFGGRSGSQHLQSATRMLDHFAARKQYESGDLGSFDRAKLIRFRDERAAYSGDRYESLYRQWEAGGDKAVAAALAGQTVTSTQPAPMFSTFSLERTYDVFGNLTAF